MKSAGQWFQKWYVAEVRQVNGSLGWYVIRVDKPHQKGQFIGPVRLSGRSCAEKAREVAEAKNIRIMEKRKELTALGFGPVLTYEI